MAEEKGGWLQRLTDFTPKKRRERALDAAGKKPESGAPVPKMTPAEVRQHQAEMSPEERKRRAITTGKQDKGESL